MSPLSRCSVQALQRGLTNRAGQLHRRLLTTGNVGKALIDNEKAVDKILGGDIKNIRNFSIVAHIDHGKSTLSDKLLERAGNIKRAQYTGEHAQTLDTLDVERMRGITVKAQGASMFYESGDQHYMLNLIDTPGHVDFSCEVSRSMRACDGALLLVDASQGVEAQTIANYELAVLSDLTVIPVLTKIDLPHADIPGKAKELQDLLGVSADEILVTSAKTGEGILDLFSAIIDRLHPPKTNVGHPLQALIYDCWYDKLKGVVCLIYVKHGEIRCGDSVGMLHAEKTYTVKELGVRTPDMRPTDSLLPGQVGYLTAAIRSPHDVHLGDTVFLIQNRRVKPKGGFPETRVYPELKFEEARERNLQFPGFKEHKCVIYAELYPEDIGDFERLGQAISELCLNDSSVRVVTVESNALGAGYRCGFLGVLHREVFCQRLEGEKITPGFLVTAPSVVFKAVMSDGSEKLLEAPEDFPEGKEKKARSFLQPMVNATILTRDVHIAAVKSVIQNYEGAQEDQAFVSQGRSILKVKFPFRTIIQGFHSDLMKATSGHGSFDYEECGWEDIDLEKISLQINGKEVGPLSLLVASHEAQGKGRLLIERLKKVIPRQEYGVKIQAWVGKMCVARESIPPWRKKNVLEKAGKTIGTGDPSRKLKVLQRQADREKKLKSIGNIHVPQEAFIGILRG